MNDEAMYPLFLNLRGRNCVVVGGNTIAEAKVRDLLQAGAAVRVIAAEVTDAIATWARDGRVQWEKRAYETGDVCHAFVVVTAVDKAMNAAVYAEAEATNTLCNAVDDIEHCNCYASSVVRRGPLQIVISTAGNSPPLAQRLRLELEQQFGPEYAEWVKELGTLRRRLLSESDLDPDARRRRLHEQASATAFESFRNAQNREKGNLQQEMKRDGEQSRDRVAATNMPARGRVCLVGAGPGDPELLTLKAVKRLSSADVVLHDALISREVLALVAPTARVLNVGKRCGRKCISQQEINSLLVSFAAEGNLVVRLKNGDPLLFGRGGEEIDALRQAGVDIEIVPGVTAAVAAAAAAKISLTDRRCADRLLLVSAHHAAGKAEPDWSGLIDSRTTIAVYMHGDHKNIAKRLIRSGLNGQTPCIVISKISLPEEQSYKTTLEALCHMPLLPAPSLLVAGETVATSRLTELQPVYHQPPQTKTDAENRL